MDSDEDDNAAAVDARLKKLLEMTLVCGLHVSCGSTFWEWDSGVQCIDRFNGVVQRWGNKQQFKLVITWEDCEAGKSDNLCDEDDGSN